MDFRIISIGTLAAHPLWGERSPVRTGHATTTLINSEGKRIIVDPGLPPQVIAARLGERAGLEPRDVTHVFLTAFKPDMFRGIMAFERAVWWVSEMEREGVGVPMAQALRDGSVNDEPELMERLQQEVALLKRCVPAPDKLAERVDLFPLPGVTPGSCGLLLAEPRHTTLIAGDAAPTVEHIEQGKVLQHAADVEQAKESLMEMIEISDLIIPGRDNITVNPTKRPF